MDHERRLIVYRYIIWTQGVVILVLLVILCAASACRREAVRDQPLQEPFPPFEGSVVDYEAEMYRRQKRYRDVYSSGSGRSFVTDYYIWSSRVIGFSGGRGRTRSQMSSELTRVVLEKARRFEMFSGSLLREQLELTPMESLVFDRLLEDFSHDSWPEPQDPDSDEIRVLREAVAQWVDQQVESLSLDEKQSLGRRGALAKALNYMIGRWTEIDESSAHLDAVMRFGNFMGVQFVGGQTVEAWRLDADGLRQLADQTAEDERQRAVHRAFWEFWIAVMAEDSLDGLADGWYDWAAPRWDAWAEQLVAHINERPDGPVALRADECVQALRQALGK